MTHNSNNAYFVRQNWTIWTTIITINQTDVFKVVKVSYFSFLDNCDKFIFWMNLQDNIVAIIRFWGISEEMIYVYGSQNEPEMS